MNQSKLTFKTSVVTSTEMCSPKHRLYTSEEGKRQCSSTIFKVRC